jgi:hypothetical protein
LTLPSRTVATFSSSPIRLTFFAFPLNWKAEVRAATRKPSTFV